MELMGKWWTSCGARLSPTASALPVAQAQLALHALSPVSSDLGRFAMSPQASGRAASSTSVVILCKSLLGSSAKDEEGGFVMLAFK